MGKEEKGERDAVKIGGDGMSRLTVPYFCHSILR